jgi:putative endonuclease
MTRSGVSHDEIWRQPDKIMFYIYVLKSKINYDLYIGYSDNLRERYKSHNSGKVKSTKGYRPWILVYYEAYRDKHDARKREIELKAHYQKEELGRRLKDSLK